MAEKKKFNLGSLFIKEEEAPRKLTATGTISATITAGAEQPTEAVTGKIDAKVMKTLRGIIAESKMDGFEYLQFKEVLNNLDIEDRMKEISVASAKK